MCVCACARVFYFIIYFIFCAVPCHVCCVIICDAILYTFGKIMCVCCAFVIYQDLLCVCVCMFLVRTLLYIGIFGWKILHMRIFRVHHLTILLICKNPAMCVISEHLILICLNSFNQHPIPQKEFILRHCFRVKNPKN